MTAVAATVYHFMYMLPDVWPGGVLVFGRDMEVTKEPIQTSML